MQDASFHLAADDAGQDFRAEGALSTSAPSAVRALDPNRIQICRVAPIRYENGQPCACPDGTCNLWKGGLKPASTKCPSLGLVDRLRNGGQPDLADMAQELVQALQGVTSGMDTNYDESVTHRDFMVSLHWIRAARAAIAKATGEQA